jgi:addiction module HigA family antidote
MKGIIMERLENVHPGEILSEEFLIPLNISAYRLSKDTEIPQTRISQILKGKRSVTADTALRLSLYFGTSPKFWLGLQDDYDIEEESRNKKELFLRIKPVRRVESKSKVSIINAH